MTCSSDGVIRVIQLSSLRTIWITGNDSFARAPGWLRQLFFAYQRSKSRKLSCCWSCRPLSSKDGDAFQRFGHSSRVLWSAVPYEVQFEASQDIEHLHVYYCVPLVSLPSCAPVTKASLFTAPVGPQTCRLFAEPWPIAAAVHHLPVASCSIYVPFCPPSLNSKLVCLLMKQVCKDSVASVICRSSPASVVFCRRKKSRVKRSWCDITLPVCI